MRRRETGRQQGNVFVVREGHAHQVTVRLGVDNGLRVAILEGLTSEDDVIMQPGSNISDGVEVAPTVED